MTQEQRSVHRTLAISESLGCRPPTSKEIDYACSVERFEPTPLHERVLYVVGFVGVVVALVFNYF